MDIHIEAERMLADDDYAWACLEGFNNLMSAGQYLEAERWRLVFCEYVCLWRPRGRMIETESDYHLNMTANDCCEPFLCPENCPDVISGPPMS